MNIRITIMALGLLAFTSCHHRESKENSVVEPTQAQQKLLDAGWTNETPDEDMSEDYGVKIMDLRTDKCIRYVYVAENTTTTVQEIPQGVYYLKLAYGYDWMEKETDDGKQGKFTRNVLYERSQDTFDFGIKNSREEVNYRLDINVVDSKLENNFQTITIDEKEFMK